VSESNKDVLDTLERWRASPEQFLAICGARQAGKTHLASILLEDGEAVSLHANDCNHARDIDDDGVLVIDGMDALHSPKGFLAFVESARNRERRVVFVGSGDPEDWSGGLRDLKTRLAAMPRISLSEPDEDLLCAVISKLLRDRQLNAPPSVALFCAPRIQKTFLAAQAFVAALDKASIEAKKPIGLGLARQVLANLSEDSLSV
jgi:chromosomal replication initiation ATPase DnaA